MDGFKSNSSSNIPGFNFIHGFLLVGKHLHNAANSLLFTGIYIVNIGACMQGS